MRATNIVGAIGAAAVVWACGSSAVPVERVASAEAAIRAAEEVGARQTPDASLHLKYAEDNLAKAERLIEEDENERAKLFLDQAQADAELAIALSRATAQRQAAEQARARVQELRQQSSSQ